MTSAETNKTAAKRFCRPYKTLGNELYRADTVNFMKDADDSDVDFMKIITTTKILLIPAMQK